jgi:riboflavin kinase, archaea type
MKPSIIEDNVRTAAIAVQSLCIIPKRVRDTPENFRRKIASGKSLQSPAQHRQFPATVMTQEVVKLRGIVRSGKGDFAQWIEKLSEHYIRKTGVQLFPGTLNVHLIDTEYPLPARHVIRLEGAEYDGDVNISILPCRIFDRPAFVLRTDTDDGKLGDPPESILEIACEVGLRSAYGLQDGDVVEVFLPADSAAA